MPYTPEFFVLQTCIGMHALSVLKRVCLQALDNDDLALFYSVVNPHSVLEMIEMIDQMRSSPPTKEQLPKDFDSIVDLIARHVYPFHGTEAVWEKRHYAFVRAALKLTNKELADEIEKALRDYFEEPTES